MNEMTVQLCNIEQSCTGRHSECARNIFLHNNPLVLLVWCQLLECMFLMCMFLLLQYKRIDVGERIQGIWLVNPQELAYYTDNEVKVFKLNMVSR